eukprot:jgi/Mesvir1/22205/Mv18800-RA.1
MKRLNEGLTIRQNEIGRLKEHNDVLVRRVQELEALVEELRREVKQAKRYAAEARVEVGRAPKGRTLGCSNPRVVGGKADPKKREYDFSERVANWLEETFAVEVAGDVIPSYLAHNPEVLEAYIIRDSGMLEKLHEDACGRGG